MSLNSRLYHDLDVYWAQKSHKCLDNGYINCEVTDPSVSLNSKNTDI